jgi:uncharacterized protein (TIGR02001 family)
MIYKTISTLLAATFLMPLLVSPAVAMDGKLSGNVTLTTDYVWRGISQSNEGPAIQGGFDYAHEESGLYAGVWASSVDFNDASTEIDIFAGMNGSFNNFVWDLGGLYYYYPGANDNLNYDFFELAGSLGYDFDHFSLSGAINYSPEFFADSGDATYIAAYLEAPLPYDITLSAHTGYQWIDDNAAYGAQDYQDWALGLGYAVQGFDLSLTYSDTDLDEPTECADNCSDRLVFAVGRNF